MIIYWCVIFIIGIIIGSFLNVCIYRIPKDESISYPPSHCTKCGNNIKFYDLIPILSYIIIKGKCRHCGEDISIRYPFVEFSTGIIFLLIYIRYGLSFEFLKYTIFTCFIVVIGIIDFDTTDIYFKTTLSGAICGLTFIIIEKYIYEQSISTYLYGALLGGGVIALIILLTKGMGWGDAELCFMSGLFLGAKFTIFMIIASFIIGSIISLILICTKKKSRKDYIPFGPFIAVAAVLTVLMGEKIIILYISSIF